MKIAVIIARILMGIIFVFFGLNGFLQFLKAPLPGGLAGQFVTVLFASHYIWFVCLVQVVGGLLLLVNRYVPLALTLLGPVIVNIILYHVVLNSAAAQLAVNGAQTLPENPPATPPAVVKSAPVKPPAATQLVKTGAPRPAPSIDHLFAAIAEGR